jgi:thiol-disulfide isomerase/thioredoxin
MNSPLTRRRWLAAGVAAAAGAAGAGAAWWRSSTGNADAGERLAPDFWAERFDRPEGGSLDFAQLKGKPLLLNFWATWCPPCIEELPMIDRFSREHDPSGWQVVGLAVDKTPAVQKFLSRTPVSFPIGLAGLEGTELVRALGNAAGGLPFTIVIGRDGRVIARKMGQLTTSDLDAWRRAELHS